MTVCGCCPDTHFLPKCSRCVLSNAGMRRHPLLVSDLHPPRGLLWTCSITDMCTMVIETCKRGNVLIVTVPANQPIFSGSPVEYVTVLIILVDRPVAMRGIRCDRCNSVGSHA